ncbi:hypothetical protein ACSL9C_002824 [Vibrio navarrensis]
MFTYINDPSSTTPHQSTTKCALLFFLLAVSSTAFAAPPIEYIKSLTVNRIGQGPIYGNGVMTAKISIGYEVSDGYIAYPLPSTTYKINNTSENLLDNGWFEDTDDNGFTHQIPTNIQSYNSDINSLSSPDSKEYITKYIGANNGTLGLVEFCITQNFKIYQKNNNGQEILIDDNYSSSTCDSGNSASTVDINSINPVYLTNNDFYFEDYVNVYDNSFTRVDYRELFSITHTPMIQSVQYTYSPYLSEENQIMRKYDKDNRETNYVDTYFFPGKANNSSYSFVSYLYKSPFNSPFNSNEDNIEFQLEEKTIYPNDRSDYIGTFINRKLKYHSYSYPYVNGASTCISTSSFSIAFACYDDKNDNAYSTNSNFNYSGDIDTAFINITDIYGTTSSIQFKYDENLMVELSNKIDN